MLATCQTYTGNPGCYKKSIEYLDAATPAKMKATLAKWIDETPYVLTILPNEKLGVSESSVDRTQGIPFPTEKVSFEFPKLQTAILSNGAKVQGHVIGASIITNNRFTVQILSLIHISEPTRPY